MYTPEEIERRIAQIEFKTSHTAACQTKNKYGRWTAPDKRKTCLGCKLSACGVVWSTFERLTTGEDTEAKAKDIVRGWYRQANAEKKPDEKTHTEIATAIDDYMETVGEEAQESTLEKYQTLMGQLQAFCTWRKIRYVQEIDQDYILEFSKALADENAGYKLSNLNEKGQRRFRKMSLDTVRRSSRTLKGLFNRCIERRWIKENPANILKSRRRKAVKNKKHEVKYLTRQQMGDIMWAVDQFPRMTDRHKTRLKALILTMRWSGLRISDATLLKTENVRNGVLYRTTKKAKTDVQIPLPDEVLSLLNSMEPYEGGYLFWNRIKQDADETTVRNNFGILLRKVFQGAGIEETNIKLISHRFRNTFAVHLLAKGVRLETVSLMLGHESIGTTSAYYAGYAHTYMDRAEKLVRRVWDLQDGETLDRD
jgi:site-specific recombinase XerD